MLKQSGVLFEKESIKKKPKEISSKVTKTPAKEPKNKIDNEKKKALNNSIPPTPNETVEKINRLVDQSESVIFRAQAVFPFDFFPDELIVDLAKVTVIRSTFFETKRVQSIAIKDISETAIEFAPFFAKLTVRDKYFAKTGVNIQYMKKDDAQKARRIIQGLTIVARENIDLAQYHINDLSTRLEELGRGDSHSQAL